MPDMHPYYRSGLIATPSTCTNLDVGTRLSWTAKRAKMAQYCCCGGEWPPTDHRDYAEFVARRRMSGIYRTIGFADRRKIDRGQGADGRHDGHDGALTLHLYPGGVQRA